MSLTEEKSIRDEGEAKEEDVAIGCVYYCLSGCSACLVGVHDDTESRPQSVCILCLIGTGVDEFPGDLIRRRRD